MLARVRFEGLKALADVTVDLAPLTVVVGPNGCGKTTLLNAVEAVCSWTIPTVRAALIGLGPDWQRARRTVGSKGGMRWFVTDADGRTVDIQVGPNGDVRCEADGERAPRRRNWLPAARTLTLQPVRIAAPNLQPLATPTIDATGFGVAATLAFLAISDRDAIGRIEADLRQIIPGFRAIQSRPAAVAKDQGGWTFDLVMQAGQPIAAAHLSEGTLCALALLTVLHGPIPYELILLDDVDRALHPAAQTRLIEVIRAIQERNPKLQMVCTTHSPDLVDACLPEEVRVMALDHAGHAHVKRLDEHPEAAKWLKMLRVGEFWSTVGEDWITGTPGA